MTALTSLSICALAGNDATSSQLSRQQTETIQKTDTYQIVQDKTVKGVRHIVAVPSNKVCSQLIEFDIKEGRIHNLVYTRGCNGNLKAIGVLLEGMTVEEAIAKLDGVECGKRGTSCTDQLAQVLKAISK
ncbi:MAG: TIGR03905 family TSCPD domain-containing protein [Bacteroidales bacterium]|nr:TIGR03905 family TSCPD domain-containing protein [Bacteroidales bacterium]